MGKREFGSPELQSSRPKHLPLQPRPLDLRSVPHPIRIPSLSFKLQLFPRNLERELLIQVAERIEMDALLIGATLLGSLVGAFVIQKAALEGLLRAMNADRRLRN
jgi:hypothetical protein